MGGGLGEGGGLGGGFGEGGAYGGGGGAGGEKSCRVLARTVSGIVLEKSAVILDSIVPRYTCTWSRPLETTTSANASVSRKASFTSVVYSIAFPK